MNNKRGLLILPAVGFVLLLSILATGCQISCSSAGSAGVEATVAAAPTTGAPASSSALPAVVTATSVAQSATTASAGASTSTLSSAPGQGTVTSKAATTTLHEQEILPTPSTLGPPPVSTTVPMRKKVTTTTTPEFTFFQETDSRMNWGGFWQQLSDVKARGGGFKSSSSESAGVFMQFYGDRILLFCPKGPDYGKIKIVLDGTPQSVIDLYAPSFGFPIAVWASNTLPLGSHWLTVDSANTKNDKSTGYTIGFDAVNVLHGTLK